MEITFDGQEDTTEHRLQWNNLIRRAAELNVFLEPSFALSAAQHFLPHRRPTFMRVELRDDSTDCQLGLFAWDQPRHGLGALARAWRPPLTALGTPLVDAQRARDVLDAVRAWFIRERPQVVGLLFPAMRADGPLAKLLASMDSARGLATRVFDRHQRALLIPSDGTAKLDHPSRHHLKEMRRQRRRLAELGTLSYRQATEPHDVCYSVEHFLVLEAAGWKGRAGTALLCDPTITTFTRCMTRQLASQGNCRVGSLELDGRPIAMGITLVSHDCAWLWKIAYDETFASYSPGVQFVLDFTLRQAVDLAITLTDSCAISNHPMIDRLWRDRIDIVDLAISTAAENTQAFERACDQEARRRKFRSTAKSSYRAVGHWLR